MSGGDVGPALILVPLAAGPRWVVLGCRFASELLSGLGVMLLDIMVGTVSAGIVPTARRFAGLVFLVPSPLRTLEHVPEQAA